MVADDSRCRSIKVRLHVCSLVGPSLAFYKRMMTFVHEPFHNEYFTDLCTWRLKLMWLDFYSHFRIFHEKGNLLEYISSLYACNANRDAAEAFGPPEDVFT